MDRVLTMSLSKKSSLCDEAPSNADIFADVFDRYYDRVYKYMRYRLNSIEEAVTVSQYPIPPVVQERASTYMVQQFPIRSVLITVSRYTVTICQHHSAWSLLGSD